MSERLTSYTSQKSFIEGRGMDINEWIKERVKALQEQAEEAKKKTESEANA